MVATFRWIQAGFFPVEFARDCLGLSGWLLQDNLTVIFVRFQWEGLALEGFSWYRYLSNKLEKKPWNAYLKLCMVIQFKYVKKYV